MTRDLTIIMPTFNKAKYIREALDSIFMQETNYHYKIIIADDGSVDATLDIVEARPHRERGDGGSLSPESPPGSGYRCRRELVGGTLIAGVRAYRCDSIRCPMRQLRHSRWSQYRFLSWRRACDSNAFRGTIPADANSETMRFFSGVRVSSSRRARSL